MRLYKCDRCGKVLGEPDTVFMNHYTIQPKEGPQNFPVDYNYEVCKDCYSRVIDILGSPNCEPVEILNPQQLFEEGVSDGDA